jgi:hypothetical protein
MNRGWARNAISLRIASTTCLLNQWKIESLLSSMEVEKENVGYFLSEMLFVMPKGFEIAAELWCGTRRNKS